MKKILVFGIMLILLLTAWTVWAGSADSIRARMDSVQRRIDDGVKAGTLTGQEAKSVQNELNSIRQGFDSAVQNGLSDREKKHFNQRLDTLSKRVYRERHDKEDSQSAGKIEEKISHLQKRMDTASGRGALTPVETKKLQSRLDGIRKHYENAQKDGKLTDQEIRSIQAKLDSLSRSVDKESRDRERSR